MITCELELLGNTFEIISAFYFTCNPRQVITCEIERWNYFKIISADSAAERALKIFQNNFSDIEDVGNYSWVAISLWNYFKIIFAAEIILDVVTCEIKHWNYFKVILFHM